MLPKIAFPIAGASGGSTWLAARRGKLSTAFAHLSLILAVLAGTACNLISAAGGSPPPTAVTSPSTQGANPQAGTNPTVAPPAKANLSDVNAVARDVYAQAQAGQDLTPELTGIFVAFGIPVLNEQADGDKGMAMIKAGKPAIFDVQLAAMGQGFANGVLINVDSLMKDFTAHGVQVISPPGPVTADYLKNALLYLTSKTSYTPGETLPALIIALGQERARLEIQKNVDPVWGDGYLDPLQYALLTYGVSFVAIQSQALAVPGRQAFAALGGDRWAPLGVVLTGKLDDGGGLLDKLLKGLDPTNIPGYIICGLYLMENSQFVMVVGPYTVYHKQTDVSNPPSYQSDIKGTLFMTADPSPRTRDLLILAGCGAPPNKGPLPGKTIGWNLDALAQQHGSLNNPETKTKDDGTVRAVYETIAETTPQAGRIAPAMQQVEGVVDATVLDLVPGHEDLEALSRLAGGAEKSGRVYLEIRFYGNLALDIAGSFQVPGKDVTVNDVIAPQTIVLTAGTNGTLTGNGPLPLTSSATFNCGSAGTVQAKGAFTGKVQVILTPTGGSDSGQLSLSFLPDLSMLHPPTANIQCTAGDLNDVAWAGVVNVLTAKPTFASTAMTYSFTPPKATGAVTFTLRPVKP